MHAFSLNFCCVIDDLKKKAATVYLEKFFYNFTHSEFQLNQLKYFTFTLFESFLTL